jgi:hypothetical protein
MSGFKSRDAKRAEKAMHDHLVSGRQALSKIHTRELAEAAKSTAKAA